MFAEKARYFISRPGEQIDADTDERNMSRSDSSASTGAPDENMTFSAEADFVASSSIDYIPPSELDLQLDTGKAVTVEITRFEIKDGIIISEVSTANA